MAHTKLSVSALILLTLYAVAENVDAQEKCVEQPQEGECLSQSERRYWYYEPSSKTCKMQRANTCAVSSNRFNNDLECYRSCQTVAEICGSQQVRGTCRALIWSAYYSAENNSCETFVYGGCNGNGNRFNDIDECTRFCVHP
ncbi:inter-alpha-trypsin inhibitor-like isoform X1 [Periplaneta americana]|uniref:inter-alpha-trypsin inhibitor-like isoform X1 n=1 Tax=Periplaneta americana TaxID=6978 RepID=UPI0037E7DBEA